jgi:hypothetical protein
VLPPLGVGIVSIRIALQHGSGDAGFTETFDSVSRHLVKTLPPVLQSMVYRPSVPTEGFPATLASESATLPPPGPVETIADDTGGGGFRQERALLVGASRTLHGFRPCCR